MRIIPSALGPAPALREPTAPLSRSQANVLRALAAGEATLAELTGLTGLHANTLRDHLHALQETGLVARTAVPTTGRGRPAWRYRATSRAAAPVAEYVGLAAALAAAIHHNSPDPAADAVAAGADWGRDLARASGPPAAGGRTAAHRQVVALLDAMGFDPSTTGTDDRVGPVRLRRCPLLDAARRYPDVVCSVHVGIAKGALHEYGADDSGVRLTPFAEPGACVLQFAQPEPQR